MPNVAPTSYILEHTTLQAPPQAIDMAQQLPHIPALATTIKQNMTFKQKVIGFFDAIYWLSPIGKIHNKQKHNLYWYIKTKL